jgi:hypothetical protein
LPIRNKFRAASDLSKDLNLRPAPQSVSLAGDDILAGHAFRYRFAFSIGVEALQAAGADPVGASFQHRPGSQSVQQSGHSALSTYECAVPRRSAPWAAPLRSIPPSTGSRAMPRCVPLYVHCSTTHSPSATEFKVVNLASGKLVLICSRTKRNRARPTCRPWFQQSSVKKAAAASRLPQLKAS